MAANQQIRLGHHEPGRQPDQTGRASAPASRQCPLVSEANEHFALIRKCMYGQLPVHLLRDIRTSLPAELHVAIHQLSDRQLPAIVGPCDCQLVIHQGLMSSALTLCPLSLLVARLWAPRELLPTLPSQVLAPDQGGAPHAHSPASHT